MKKLKKHRILRKSMKYKTITFYKFVNLANPEEIMGYFRGLCEALDLKGRILIGHEGINAGVSGEVENMEKFKEQIQTNREFKHLSFREHPVTSNSYHKLVVKVRKEIITMGVKVDMTKTAEHISPETLNKWLDKKEEFIILDARNDYEAEIGKFEGAKVLPIKNFSDFPKVLKEISDLKDKKIVTYCTGGIRCEKATALMKEKGFNNVFQLEGGIINYVNKFPDRGFKGEVFVFDDRLNEKTGSEDKLGVCGICNESCNDYTDCYNLDCDKLFICCSTCKEKMNNTCCEECKTSNRHRALVIKQS